MPKYLMRKMGMSSLGVVLALHSVAPAYALHPLGRHDTPETLAYYGNDPSFSFVKEVTLQRTQCSATKIGETATEDVYLSASHCFSGRPPSGNVRHYELHPEYTMYPRVSHIVSMIGVTLLLAYSPKLLSLVGFTMPSPVSLALSVMSFVMMSVLAPVGFALRSYKYDLAVVFTDKTDTPMAPLYQGDYGALNHQKATVVGYGTNYFNRLVWEEGSCSLIKLRHSPPRQAAEVEVTYDFGGIFSSWLFPLHPDERDLFLHQTAPLRHNQKPYAMLSKGDSGGPLLWRNPQGAWEVIGVSSRTMPNFFSMTWYNFFLNLIQNQEDRDYFIEDRGENIHYNEFHKVCATSFINPLGDCSSLLSLCYGASLKWATPDHSFIQDIFQKYNVTTTRGKA